MPGTSLQEMFNSAMKLALTEERKRAEDLRKAVGEIPVYHLNCECGKPVKERLLRSLLTASSPAVANFMSFMIVKNEPSESQAKMRLIESSARNRHEAPVVVFVEELSKMEPLVRIGDIINSLEHYYLFRVIASLDHQTVFSLSEHRASHCERVCCADSHMQPVSRLARPISPLDIRENGLLPISGKGKKGSILLTFMEDGRHHALNLRNVLEKPSGKNSTSYVPFMLSNFGQALMEDTSRTIALILSLVDFVVPVLTDRYFEMLDGKTLNSGSIDEMYASHVARILTENWSCSFRNKWLRCFKPNEVKWPASKLIFPPFLTFVSNPSDLPLILLRKRN